MSESKEETIISKASIHTETYNFIFISSKRLKRVQNTNVEFSYNSSLKFQAIK